MAPGAAPALWRLSLSYSPSLVSPSEWESSLQMVGEGCPETNTGIIKEAARWALCPSSPRVIRKTETGPARSLPRGTPVQAPARATRGGASVLSCLPLSSSVFLPFSPELCSSLADGGAGEGPWDLWCFRQDSPFAEPLCCPASLASLSEMSLRSGDNSRRQAERKARFGGIAHSNCVFVSCKAGLTPGPHCLGGSFAGLCHSLSGSLFK